MRPERRAAALVSTKPRPPLFFPILSPSLLPATLGKSLRGTFVCLNKGDEVVTLNMIKSAPVGPVAGGIMGCIMVLVLAVYAYRHQIHRRSHQHMSPLAAQGELQVNPKLLREAAASRVSFQGWKDGSRSRKPMSA